MEIPSVSQDDIEDVMEMKNKLENYIYSVLKDTERNLAMSALISACINSMLSQCRNLEEIVAYRNVFSAILDTSIGSIQIKKPEKFS